MALEPPVNAAKHSDLASNMRAVLASVAGFS